MAAAWAGRTENIRFLLDHGANIDARDNVGDTALLASAGAGAMSAVGVIYTVEPMKLLLARGADINARNNNGDTALTLAAATGGYEDLATVKLLLRSGADPAARNNKGDSALALATRHHRRRIAATLTAAMEK
jgi:ankyrin repeat protein